MKYEKVKGFTLLSKLVPFPCLSMFYIYFLFFEPSAVLIFHRIDLCLILESDSIIFVPQFSIQPFKIDFI